MERPQNSNGRPAIGKPLVHSLRVDEDVQAEARRLAKEHRTTMNQGLRYALGIDETSFRPTPRTQAVRIVTEAMEPRRITGTSNEALAEALADAPPERPKAAQPLKLQQRPKPTPAPASNPIENWRDRRAAKGALPRPGEKPPPGKK